MSPRPSASAGKRRSRLTAMNTRFTLMCLVLSRLLRNVLEQLARLVGGAVLLGLVDEVVGLVERHQHPDEAALDHPVEIAGPRLERGGNRGVRGGVRRWRGRRPGRRGRRTGSRRRRAAAAGGAWPPPHAAVRRARPGSRRRTGAGIACRSVFDLRATDDGGVVVRPGDLRVAASMCRLRPGDLSMPASTLLTRRTLLRSTGGPPAPPSSTVTPPTCGPRRRLPRPAAKAGADALDARRAEMGKTPIARTRLTDASSCWPARAATSLVLHGPDGLLVVDSFVRPAWPQLKSTLDAIDGSPIKTADRHALAFRSRRQQRQLHAPPAPASSPTRTPRRG